MKVITTFDQNAFANLGVTPSIIDVSTIESGREKPYLDTRIGQVPNMEELHNRKFYITLDNRIIAVKIVAWYWTKNFRVVYVLWTPNGLKKVFLNGPIYTNIDDLTNERNGVEIKYSDLVLKGTDINYGSWGCNDKQYYKIKESYIYSKYYGEVIAEDSKIMSVVGTIDGIVIQLAHPMGKDYKSTRKEALKARYNGMEIEDFNENVTINITLTKETNIVKSKVEM